MRILLAVALLVLFSWLYGAWMSDGAVQATPCEAASASEALVSLLLSPLSLYSGLTSALVRLVVSAPPLVFSAIRHSVLLLLATPACALGLCASVLLTCVRAALYLLHVVLVGCVAIWTLRQERADVAHEKVKRQAERRLRMFGCVKRT